MTNATLIEKYLIAGGFKTRYLEGGNVDGMTVVLLHDGGYGGCADTSWGRVAPILAQAGYHVVIPDMVGFGGTEKAYYFDRSPVAYRMKHIGDFCTALALSDVHFIGNSFGGTLIMRALSMNPLPWPMASACSIAGTGGPWRVPEAMAALGEFDGTTEAIARTVSMIADPTYAGFDFEGYVKERHARSLIPGHYAALSAARLQAPWEHATQSAQADAYPGSLKDCKVPLLLIDPDDDPTCQRGWPAKIQEVLPTAQVAALSGRHSPNVDRPELVADLLLSWLQRMENSKAPSTRNLSNAGGKALTETIVSLLKDAEFKTEGLRNYFAYRDLGVTEATGGRFVARVARPHGGLPITAGWHVHYADFRMLYILNGWVKFHYRELGTFTLNAGDVIFQAPDAHAEIEHSQDVEILEVATPAGFPTDDCNM